MRLLTNEEYIKAVDKAKLYDYFYFIQSNPIVKDEDYDELYFAIQEFEHVFPTKVLPDSPTQRAGTGKKNGKHTIAHRTPMLSTYKCNSVEDLVKWANKLADKVGKNIFTVEWKYDGVSCSLVYLDGTLVEASTRGENGYGQDILCHVRNIDSVPKVLKARPCKLSERVEVRGEILMPKSALEQLPNGTYGDTRTAASAIINTIGETQYDQYLQFYPWQIIMEPVPFSLYGGQTSALHFLNKYLGFKWSDSYRVTANAMEKFVRMMESTREEQPFPTDGLVIKLDDITEWESLGGNDHHPNYLIAYKFPPKTKETICTEIEITIGGSGRRTPIAHFEPVQMLGKTYTRASLGSERVAAEKGIKVGSRIEVCLKNDVIPLVLRVIE